MAERPVSVPSKRNRNNVRSSIWNRCAGGWNRVGLNVCCPPNTTSRSVYRVVFEIRRGGHVLQDLKVHTSCSKSLEIGDQFGAVILRDYVPE